MNESSEGTELTGSAEERERLNSRVEELEREVARLVEERAVQEVELEALRADLALKADFLVTLEKIPEEVVAPKDVHIRNLEAIITQLNEALVAAARPTRRSFVRRLAGTLRRTVVSRAT